MKVLVVGSGAREHAIVWKLALSPNVDTIYCAPGNGGTALIAQNVELPSTTEAACDQLAGWAYNNDVDLVIVGPELPLRHALADSLMVFGVKVAGPTQLAARIEWSKSWAKSFMERHGIPTPRYEVVEGLEAARQRLRSSEIKYPVVVKADGLAGGMGAEIARSVAEAENMLDRMTQLTGKLTAEMVGSKVVIEEYLEGTEVSAIAFTDGRNVSLMPPVCAYKRLLDGDGGPLTGGMGAYTPTQLVTPELWAQLESSIIQKAVHGMVAEGIPFRGFLYAGLMITPDGPKVLEFNCRLGDPETQVLLPRLKTPLEDIAMAIAAGDLSQVGQIEWDGGVAVGVVLAAENYPMTQAPPRPAKGLADVEEGVLVFHGSTQLLGAIPLNPMQPASTAPTFKSLFRGKSRQTTPLGTDFLSPQLTATGGRIFTVVATAPSVAEACEKAYRNVERIRIEGVHYRRDIAARELVSS